MNYFARTLQLDDVSEILEFENQKLAEQFQDEDERMIQSWKVKWRKEALEHYAKLGWSFLLRDREQASAFSDEGLLVGYFIAQPLLFVDGQTQSLWVEHVQYSALKARDELAELAYKISREKHFQRVYFMNENSISNSISAFKPEPWATPVLAIKTTRSL